MLRQTRLLLAVLAGLHMSSPAQAADTATDETLSTVAPKRLDPVVVTASRVEEPALDAPSAVSVLDRLQISTSPAGNVAELLRGVPGLNVIQSSTRDVSVRARGAVGMAENSQLALLDGRSIYLDYYGIVVWDYLPLEFDEIERIEVMRGPGSVMWGANALNGVINFISRSPRDLAGGLVTARVGEQGSRGASLRWAGVDGALSYKVSASAFEQDPWERSSTLPNGSPLPFGYDFGNQGTEQNKLDLRLDYDPNAETHWSFRLGRGGTTGIFQSNIGPFALQPGAHVSYASAAYRDADTHVQVYWNQLRGDAPALLSGLPFGFALDTFVAEASQTTDFASGHRLVYGGELRSNHFDLSVAPLDDRRDQAGAFAEVQLDFDQWELFFGGRLDWFDTLGTTFSPRVSLLLHPRADQTLRLSWAQSYRAPSLVDNYMQVRIPTLVPLDPLPPFVYFLDAAGNPDLKEEQARSLELSYGLYLDSGWLLSANVYQQTARDQINFLPVAFYSAANPPPGWPLPPATVPPFTLPSLFTFVNLGEVRDRGFELSAEREWAEGLRTQFSYTWQDRPELSDAGGLPLPLNEPPRHQARFAVLADRGEAWFGSASLAWTDRAFWADVLDARFWGETESYLLLDASLGHRFGKRFEAVLKVNNLLDRNAQQHVYGDLIGRRGELELRYRF